MGILITDKLKKVLYPIVLAECYEVIYSIRWFFEFLRQMTVYFDILLFIYAFSVI